MSSAKRKRRRESDDEKVLKPVQRRNLFKSKPAGSTSTLSDNANSNILGGDEHREMSTAALTSQFSVQQPSQLNASLDPDMRLTQYLQTMAEEQDESEADVTLDPHLLMPGLAVDQHKEGGCPLRAGHLGQADSPLTSRAGLASSSMLDDSFDRVPERKKQRQDDFAYTEVVRKQEERRKLQGFSCQECKRYYSAAGLSEAELATRMAQCSRHRARQAPPSTPEHFWSVGFPDSEECNETE